MEHRAGTYVKNLSGELEYESFQPTPLPPEGGLKMEEELTSLLVEANGKLVLLEGLSQRIPSMKLFVSMYVRKEALLSSQIEGTQATLEDILDPEQQENANRDVEDVVNYTRAVDYAIQRLATLPLCNRLLRETHAVLMENVRGQEKTPGEFRYTQNWIGGQGSTLKSARYIPPNPADMVEAMSQLEQFINSEEDLHPLLCIALIHYQFETIHPFLDGNGRIGRLMIPLYLMEKGLLSSPALYISCFLKENRLEYYDRMSQVRRTGDYEQWVKFFLQAVSAASADAVETIDDLSALHEKMTLRIEETYSAPSQTNALRLFAYLEENPIIEIQKTAEALSMAYNTVAKFVADFEKLGILTVGAKNKKSRVYFYEPYLAILRKDTL